DSAGNLFAATGDKGLIYKITPDGKAAVFYKTNATHVTALTFDKSGNLLAGTGTPGKVLRIDRDGKGFVLLDSPFQDTGALRFDDKGALYVAAISGRPGAGSAPVTTELLDRPTPEPTRTPVATVSAEITSMSIVDVSSGSSASGSTREDRR